MASKPKTYSPSFPLSPLYPTPAESNQQSAIAALQQNWHRLCDVDRARAAKALIQSGISGRGLAKHLNCSEPTIRRLLQILQDSPADLELARSGEISTNQLVFRAKANQLQREARQREAAERKRADEAAKRCRDILRWLAQSDDGSGNAEWIREARARVGTGLSSDLQRKEFPKAMKLPEIIDSCRPERSSDELDVSWFARWLLAWTYQVISDPNVRWNALDLAWNRACSRFWMSDL